MTGFIQSFTAPDGTSYPNAYWYPRLISFDPVTLGGNIQYIAYASQAAFTENPSQPIPYSDASKSYQLTADMVNAFLIGANLVLATLLAPVDAFALSVKDMQTGVDDSDDPIMASFFTRATSA